MALELVPGPRTRLDEPFKRPFIEAPMGLTTALLLLLRALVHLSLSLPVFMLQLVIASFLLMENIMALGLG